MTAKAPSQIDVAKVLREKNPGLARLIPGFIMRWVKRTLHEAEINEVLLHHGNLEGAAFASHVVDLMGAKLTSHGKQHIPETGGAIIASNHPLGGLDGMMLLIEAAKVRPDVRFIVNDILMNLPQFQTVFIPVNKVGRTARESLQRVEETYSSGKLVLIFPAGLCSRKQGGNIKDLPWSKSFISRSIKNNLPVIPTHIHGHNSDRFYNLALWRKRLGIKANIEMFFLVDEMFRQKGKKVQITFGKPIPAETFDHRHSQEAWAQLLRDFVYLLEKNPGADFETYIQTQ
ncbi:MAG: 1-acyl-sn-glycerol-3-phosphate acyltransferase [Bacteroidetes bacterium]|nr:1-acyl-sn-glycerol-3-phosphate acyltransferase [Bacteroidota bacterium]